MPRNRRLIEIMTAAKLAPYELEKERLKSARNAQTLSATMSALNSLVNTGIDVAGKMGEGYEQDLTRKATLEAAGATGDLAQTPDQAAKALVEQSQALAAPAPEDPLSRVVDFIAKPYRERAKSAAFTNISESVRRNRADVAAREKAQRQGRLEDLRFVGEARKQAAPVVNAYVQSLLERVEPGEDLFDDFNVKAAESAIIRDLKRAGITLSPEDARSLYVTAAAEARNRTSKGQAERQQATLAQLDAMLPAVALKLEEDLADPDVIATFEPEGGARGLIAGRARGLAESLGLDPRVVEGRLTAALEERAQASQNAALNRQLMESRIAKNRASASKPARTGLASGKPVNESTAKALGGKEEAIQAVDELLSFYDDKIASTATGTGEIAGRAKDFANLFFEMPDWTRFRSMNDRVVQIVGKALEEGKLAEGDAQRYTRMLTSGNLDDAEYRQLLVDIRNSLARGYGTSVEALGASGRNVQNYRGRVPSTPGGMVRVRLPDGRVTSRLPPDQAEAMASEIPGATVVRGR